MYIYLDILTGDVLNFDSKQSDVILNKNIIFDQHFFVIKYKQKKYVPKTYDIYKKFISSFYFLKDRTDVDLLITDNTVKEYFSEYTQTQIQDALIFQYILHTLEGLSMSVFKFQVDIKSDGKVFFEMPLPLDNKLDDFYLDKPNVIFIDSSNVYNVLCGLLKEFKRVYTYKDKLFNLSVEDLVILDSTAGVVNIHPDDYSVLRELELYIRDTFGGLIAQNNENYFRFNLLLNYFLSKHIYIDMFLSCVEDVYEKVIEEIDKQDNVEVEEDLLDKLEELLLLKSKIEKYLEIEKIHTSLKKELSNNTLSDEEKKEKLLQGKEKLEKLKEEIVL